VGTEDDQEENRFSARAARYVKVGTNVGAVAARVASQRLFGMDADDSKNAAALAAALGGLKGPIMKVAQLMATIPEALPAEYAEQLSQLQSQAPPMGPAFVRRRMIAELGTDWQSRFRSFEPQSAASASLGQVHRAVAHDGRALACKLQYPDMNSAVEADLNQLKVVFALHARMNPAIDTAEILQEVSARLREELDYDLEARHMALYDAIFADEPRIRVRPLPDCPPPAADHDMAQGPAPARPRRLRWRTAIRSPGRCSRPGGTHSRTMASSTATRILATTPYSTCRTARARATRSAHRPGSTCSTTAASAPSQPSSYRASSTSTRA
jgi:hypothetical protein